MKKSQSIKKKKTKILIATLGIAAMIVGGLSFAWYSSTDSVTNTFQANGTFKTVVVENFVPPTNWEPGTTTDKVVQVTNTGTIDAYTRVQLVPHLTYDIKGASVEIGEGFSAGINDAYAVVNAEAIEQTVLNWNNGNTTDPYEKLTNETVKTVLGENATIPDGVTLYAKKSTGTTNYTSGIVGATNTGVATEKYELLAYYTATGTNGESNETTVNYEVAITFDNSALRAAGYDFSDNDGFVTVNTTDSVGAETSLSSTVVYSLYSVTHQEFTDIDEIDELVTINLTDDYADNWYRDTDAPILGSYHYYKHILKSGQTTSPVIESVTFNGDFDMNGISNLTFDLTVNEVSTQAIMEAAIATFGDSDTTIDTADLSKNNKYASIIDESEQNWQSDFTSAPATENEGN